MIAVCVCLTSMLCVLWVGEDLLGELEAVLVLLLLVAFLKGENRD